MNEVRIDHAAAAAEWISDASDEYTREGGPIRENVADWLAFAQVHAQLAVAEQLRIGNQIALATKQPASNGAEVWISSWEETTGEDGNLTKVTLRPDIAAALGVSNE